MIHDLNIVNIKNKLFVIILGSLLLAPSLSLGAISSDAFSSSATTGTTLTYSHVVGATSTDNYLLTWVWVIDNTAVSSVTYNGTAMTLVNTLANTRYQYLYKLDNPTTGTHNVVVTLALSKTVLSWSESFYGVDSVEADHSQGANGTSVTDSVTTIASNAWVVGGTRADGANCEAGAGTTRAFNDSGNNLCIMHSSSNPIASAQAVNIISTQSAPDLIYSSIASLAPVAQASTSTASSTNMTEQCTTVTVGGTATTTCYRPLDTYGALFVDFLMFIVMVYGFYWLMKNLRKVRPGLKI